MDTALDPGRIALFYAFNIVKHCLSDRFISGVDGLTDHAWFGTFCLPLSPLPPLGKRVSLFNDLPAEVDTCIANTEVSWPWSESSYLVLPLATERTCALERCISMYYNTIGWLCGRVFKKKTALSPRSI